MKTIRRTAGRGLALLLALVLACGMALSAYAADNASLDFTQTGSIELTLADSDGNAVSGGSVTLYQVATLYLDDGDMAYAYTDGFADCGVTLDVEDTSLAETLADYAASKGVSGTTLSIGSSGTVSFGGLELGLYLVVQTTESDNYETISPFVVTVPLEEDGVWVYDVDASPKVGAVTPTEPEPDEPDESTTTTTTTTVTKTLPQTGQLNWPVPVLAICGAVLFALGWCLTRSDRKRSEYAK
ncbi:MAG: peptidase [Clostridiales bacterium]|nr:peptidase [Clostridiales bacterium]